MSELVDEDVRRPEAVRRHGAVLAENSAASIGSGVRQDLDELVGSEGGHVAERPVVEGQDVALAAERVVRGADPRAAMDAHGGPRNSRLLGRRADGPDVEISAPALERLDGKEKIRQASRVLLELPA